jgi:DegV family protein with EDD domain
MSIAVVTDTTCDLQPDVLAQHGIDAVPLYINMDGRSYLDGVDISREEFYERLPGLRKPPTTSAPGMGTFIQRYEELAERGAREILSIHISAALSNVVNVARLAAEEYHRIKVHVIDSGQLSLGVGLIAMRAARLAAEGMDIQEVLRKTIDYGRRAYCFAGLSTLEYLRRSGRVSSLVAGIGNWLELKPLLKMNAGDVAMERVRTRRKALERLVSLVRDLGPLEQLALVHTHDPEESETLRGMAAGLFPTQASLLRAEVTPVIGSHIGPGAVGFVAVRAA